MRVKCFCCVRKLGVMAFLAIAVLYYNEFTSWRVRKNEKLCMSNQMNDIVCNIQMHFKTHVICIF